MAGKLTVRTDVEDLAAAVQLLADNTDDTSLVLFAAEAVTQGEWLRFEVLLTDGTPVLEGVGRCEAFYDNGAAGRPERRFDVILDNLQFDGRNEIMHERILLAATAIEEDQPQTSEVDIRHIARKKVAQPPPVAVPPRSKAPRSRPPRPPRSAPPRSKSPRSTPRSTPPRSRPPRPKDEPAVDPRADRADARRATARKAAAERDAARAARDGADAAVDHATGPPTPRPPTPRPPTPGPPAPEPQAGEPSAPVVSAAGWEVTDETDASFTHAPLFAQAALGGEGATKEATLPEVASAATSSADGPEPSDPEAEAEADGPAPLAQTRVVNADAMLEEARSSARSLEPDPDLERTHLHVPRALHGRAASLASRLGRSPEATLLHALRTGLAALEAQHAPDAWDTGDE